MDVQIISEAKTWVKTQRWKNSSAWCAGTHCRKGTNNVYQTAINSNMQTIITDPNQRRVIILRISSKDKCFSLSKEEAEAKYGGISQSAQTALFEDCMNNDCKTQTTISIQTRDALKKQTYEFQKKFLHHDSMANVERMFSAIFDYKKALFDKNGLSAHVAPADNGLVDGDILLSEEQANYLTSQLNKNGRKKRNAAFIDGNNNFAKKWDVSQPIPYMFDDTFEESEKAMVRQALSMISNAVSCIRFEYDPNAHTRGHFLYYTHTENMQLCGLSRIGRQDNGNPIQINFYSCDNTIGVIVHETMHCLGVAHMHARPDREKFIEILWGKIDPQSFDKFHVSDPDMFSTYGTPFSFDSIMMYKWNIGKKSRLSPWAETMRPLESYATNKRAMGQRTQLGASDIELLNKMYCMDDCQDKDSKCGHWASSLGLCRDAKYSKFMKSRCKKSCGYCGWTKHY